MKISNPYGTGGTVTLPPDTISGQMAKANGKATARYPSGKASNKPGGGGGSGSMKSKAYTPGTTPTGS